jgi:hypothetical protein
MTFLSIFYFISADKNIMKVNAVMAKILFPAIYVMAGNGIFNRY